MNNSQNVIHRAKIFGETFGEKNARIVIYGPTACGKTHCALEIASALNSEVISADARQIYRGMHIGTGKISLSERGNITHHMLDIRNPDEPYCVAEFQKEALRPMKKLWKEQKVPIICGGTGLYIDSLLFERSYNTLPYNPERRYALESFRKKNGNSALWEILMELDPEYAQTLHPNNYTYIIRAIEIFETTGKSKRSFSTPLTLQSPTLFISPYTGDREILYKTIDQRVEKMFEDGLVAEVTSLRDSFGTTAPGLATIGYKEIGQYLDGSIDETTAKKLIKQHSRNYAKRQITWNKKYLPFL